MTTHDDFTAFTVDGCTVPYRHVTCDSVLIPYGHVKYTLRDVRPSDAINIRETKNVFERTNMLINRSCVVKLITCQSFSGRHSCGSFCTLSFFTNICPRTYQKK